nr:patatin-like phospholipase family protein [Polyangium spumosum]
MSLPGCACRAAFQFGVLSRLVAAGERFDVVAGASSGSVSGAALVAGLADVGPDLWRSMAKTPVVSRRYLASERSPFGMSAVLRGALERFLPEEKLHGTEAELLVATTHARRFFAGRKDALVVHSNHERRDMHDVLVASCFIPVIYARVPRLDGEVHMDGGAADNTLIDALVARGATDITVISPFAGGKIARTLFSPEAPPTAPPHVRLRLLFPERPLRQRHFDFDPGPMEEALTMPHRSVIVEPRNRCTGSV